MTDNKNLEEFFRQTAVLYALYDVTTEPHDIIEKLLFMGLMETWYFVT